MSRHFHCVVYRNGDPRRGFACAASYLISQAEGCEQWCCLKDANAHEMRVALGVDPFWPPDHTREPRDADHKRNDELQNEAAKRSEREGAIYMRQLDIQFAAQIAQQRKNKTGDRTQKRRR